ncbi:MAG: rhomboid family intramembrane serine protease, partial [Marivirga sp.]|nr:rhomboid family intramembrane serine protease [Marivirga sp.]
MLRLTPVVRNLIFINVIVFIFQKIMPGLGNWLPLYSVHR